VGGSSKKIKPRRGWQKITNGNFFRPIRGVSHLYLDNQGSAVGCFLPLLRSCLVHFTAIALPASQPVVEAA
jgi:hypothetical protein